MKSKIITDSYGYANREQEFVVCHKNRPFVILVSPNLPTPTSSYIDHHLVEELKLKMTEISCKKLSFAGRKLRILGKVSFTMQCVHDGNVFGTLHFKGTVGLKDKHGKKNLAAVWSMESFEDNPS